MRQAGTIPTRQDAERFANYLLSLGITSKVEPAGGEWAIWIHDENQIPRSKQELDQFQLAPNDPRYREAEHAARAARREAAEKKRQAERNFIDLRNEWANPWRRRPVTMALIIASVVVFLGQHSLQESLLISSDGSLAQVREGQIWRLVTPIFLHFGILHILFNMYWLYDLGTMIERRLGAILYVLLILAIAVPSNYAQFLATGPGFGGMSGVVFGLFGYAWVRGRVEPTSGLYVRPDVAFWMLAWFALCAANVISNVANWAHGVGLAVGAALGYLAYLGHRFRRNT
jgi:GlpG protein